jgi:hypothetical protein
MAVTKEIKHVDKAPELDDLNAVIERPVEVIGDREKAYRRLGAPLRAIAYANSDIPACQSGGETPSPCRAKQA